MLSFRPGSAQIRDSIVSAFIYNQVSKNVLAYNIRNASPELNGARPKDVLEISTEFFDWLLPDQGFNLIMNIDTSNMVYPIKTYKVYKIFIGGFEYQRGMTHTKTNAVFLRKNHFLVAVDSNTNPSYIKYISGQLYPTRISEDFGVNINDPKSFLEYLRFRSYSNQVKSIQFKKAEDKSLIFTGYSQTMESNVRIIVKKDDLERPEVIKE